MMTRKRWILITRYREGIWEELADYLKVKVKEVGETKAIIFTGKGKECIRKKLAEYNKEYGTDFFTNQENE